MDGFGNDYKGKLMRSGQWIDIIARKFDNEHGQGNKEFWMEVSMLSSLKHENLTSIIGFCDEDGEKIVIIKHDFHGHLDQYLNDPINLTWIRRLQICVDVGRALSNIYYEEGRDFSVIHRDIKSSKILLDAEWNAKLFGFELSINRATAERKLPFYTDACGTPGYCDPAYAKQGIVSHKSDMFSLGVVLFQVLCGKREAIVDDMCFFQIAKSHYEEGTLEDIVDPGLRKQMDQESLTIFSGIAHYCLNEQPSERADSAHILPFLEKALESQQKHESHHLIPRAYSATTNGTTPVSLKSSERQADIDRVVTKREGALESQRKHENHRLTPRAYAPAEGTTPVNLKFSHLQMGLEEILSATNEFSDENLIRRGGFGKTYKGQLLRSGQLIDIVARRLDTTYRQGKKEFLMEVSLLSTLKHENIVSIVGFCDQGKEKIIINKHETNGSLDNHLGDHVSLTWMRRLEICVGVACGLRYIHYDKERNFSVIHRNVKSSKILLDDNWKPKLSGFELSMKTTIARRHRLVLDRLSGTIGYIDPKYEKTLD